VSSVVTEVAAGELDPSWVGQLFEVVEDTRDGPMRTGFRLRGYAIPGEGGGKVRLVTEWTTLAVDPAVVLKCFAVAAVPDRWTGVLPPGGPPAAGYPPVPVPVAGPVAARPPSAYPAPQVPQPVPPRPVGPAGPPPWQPQGGQLPGQGGWAQPGGQ
jgi:hypothetical protein